MTKVKLRTTRRLAPAFAPTLYAPRGVKFREVFSHVDVARMPPGHPMSQSATLRGPFIACVKVGQSGKDPLAACASGRNPRAAIAAALTRAAKHLRSARRGAFARYR